MSRAGLGAVEPSERVAAARGLPSRRPGAAGDVEVHPRRAALRPGAPRPPAKHGVRRRYAQQPLHHAAHPHGAGLREPSRRGGEGGCSGAVVDQRRICL